MRFALGLTIFVAGVTAAAPAIAADGTPTFTKDVAPIFYKSCIECHRQTMFAPMSLTSYEDARPWLRSIKQRVTARTMPPWGSDMPGSSHDAPGCPVCAGFEAANATPGTAKSATAQTVATIAFLILCTSRSGAASCRDHQGGLRASGRARLSVRRMFTRS